MLIVPAECYDRMIAHCRMAYPNEGCGVLGGSANRVDRVVPVTNAERSPFSYLFDSSEQFRVLKQFRGEGRSLLGVFHSHVASRAYPSKTDVCLAWDSGVVQVIVSLARVDDPVARAYRIDGTEIVEIVLQVDRATHVSSQEKNP